MCEKEESVYGAAKSLKIEILDFLWGAWATETDSSNWVQKEESARVDN